MKCELCGKASQDVKLIHLDDYNLDAHLCPQCYKFVTSGYIKENQPISTHIEKADGLNYTDAKGGMVPAGVPKFRISIGEESHTFGLMSFSRKNNDLTKWFYQAVEIYPENTSHTTSYSTEYHFNTYASESAEEGDQRRIKAYQALKEKMAASIAYKTLKKGSLATQGMFKIDVDEKGKVQLLIDGQPYHLEDLSDYLREYEGLTLNYTIKEETDTQFDQSTVLLPVEIDDDYFYNELFDIIISFSSVENFIPLDNVQKFSLFYRKLLKSFKNYLKVKPENAYMQALTMMDLLKQLDSDDQYFPEVCRKELQKILREF